MKKYYIKTYGCQMNFADSEKLAKVLESAGYSPTLDIGLADIVLVNTCVVRQHAEDRAAWFVTSIKSLKEKNPAVKIGLCGCFVTEPGRDYKKQFPHVDWFIGPNGAEELERLINSPPLSPSLDKRGGDRAACPERSRGKRGGGELLTIMRGCDNFCSYCVVPYVRGREYSRPMDEVLAEIESLIKQGVTDITLLGQNVNSYKYGLAKLLKEIESQVPPRPLGEGEKGVRVNFLTSHPRDMTDEIIETVSELPSVAKEFMMPLQSGDDEILLKMNRGYTLQYYKERVNKIRALMPKARITTDILVGFPGETEGQFENTLRAIEEINFNEVHMFAYSSRPMTAAAKLPDQLPEEVKKMRLQKLISIARAEVKAQIK